jgi:hypothetical protein
MRRQNGRDAYLFSDFPLALGLRTSHNSHRGLLRIPNRAKSLRSTVADQLTISLLIPAKSSKAMIHRPLRSEAPTPSLIILSVGLGLPTFEAILSRA